MNMEEALTFVAYGLLLLSGSFMILFWGRIAFRRFRSMGCKWHNDKYCLLASFLTLAALGTTTFFGAKAYQFVMLDYSLVYLSSPSSYIVLVGLYTLVCAKVGFVWTVHCTRSSLVWRTFLLLAGVWLIGAFLWVTMSPIKLGSYGG